MNNLPKVVSIDTIVEKDKPVTNWKGEETGTIEGYYVIVKMTEGEPKWIFAEKSVINSHYDWADAQCKVNPKLDWQEIADKSILDSTTISPSRNGQWLEGKIASKGGQRARRP